MREREKRERADREHRVRDVCEYREMLQRTSSLALELLGVSGHLEEDFQTVLLHHVLGLTVRAHNLVFQRLVKNQPGWAKQETHERKKERERERENEKERERRHKHTSIDP